MEHFIEYEKHRAIVRKMTRRQRREDWDKFVKTVERDITGTQRRGCKIFKHLQLQERDTPKTDPIKKKQNGKNTMENSGMSKAARVKKNQKRRGEVKGQTTTKT